MQLLRLLTHQAIIVAAIGLTACKSGGIPASPDPQAQAIAAARQQAKLAITVDRLMINGKTLPVELTEAFFPKTPAPANDRGINVLLDQAHQTSFAVLWGFKGLIGGEGYRCVTNLAALDTVLTPGKQSRIRLAVNGAEPFAWWKNPEYNVVITTQGDTNAQFYTEKEIAALTSFVNAGGGLLIQAGHPGTAEIAEGWSLNRLAKTFGAKITHHRGRVDELGGSVLELTPDWTALKQDAQGQVIRARRSFGKGRICIFESLAAITPDGKLSETANTLRKTTLNDTLAWLAAGKAPVGGNWNMPGCGGAGIYPEKALDLGGLIVYYADNQPASTMKCINEQIPAAHKFAMARLPTRQFAEPYNIVICAGSGGGWAIMGRPKGAAVIAYDPLEILGIYAHELIHTMGGPGNAKGEIAGSSPHHNQGEAHAGWMQGKIGALFSGKLNEANRNCNSILDLEKSKGAKLDFATEYENAAGHAKWGKGPYWTKMWYVWQKLDDRYGPTWYPRWYWVRSTRWQADPKHAETWEEMVEDMSIAVGEDLFPFMKKTGMTLKQDRLERIEFQGKTLELPIAPIDYTPAGNVNLDPIGDYTKPLKPVR
jgi:hypothetical protein